MEYLINKKESDRIKIIKIICAFLIVFHHSNNFLTVYPNPPLSITYLYESFKMCLSSACVPVFFIISSILYYRKEHNYLDNLKKKAKTLLVPYFIINIFWILTYYLFQKNPSIASFFQETSIINNLSVGLILKKCGITTQHPICGQLWFLRDLFILNIFAPFIKKIFDKFPSAIIAVLCLWLFLPRYIYIYIYMTYILCC